MRVIMGLAFLAGASSSIWWYKPGELYMQAAVMGTVACGIVAMLAVAAVIAVLRLLR